MRVNVVVEFVIGASYHWGYEQGELIKKSERNEQKEDM